MADKSKILAKKNEAKKVLSFSSAKGGKNKSSLSSKTTFNGILNLQRTIGNQSVRNLIQSGKLQAKLKIGKPNDIYEKEADRTADKVMSMPGKQSFVQSKSVAEQIAPLVQRKEEEKEEAQTKLQRQEEEKEENAQAKLQLQPEEEDRKPPQEEEKEEAQAKSQIQKQEEEKEETQTKLQRQEEEKEEAQTKGAPGGTPNVSKGTEASIKDMKGRGQPLPESTRSFFEPRFGTDFRQVRVHTDTKAAETAKAINAKAFTKGKDVVFGANEYSPGTSSGKKLLAHELTHVIQQGKQRKELNKKFGDVYSKEISQLAKGVQNNLPDPIQKKQNDYDWHEDDFERKNKKRVRNQSKKRKGETKKPGPKSQRDQWYGPFVNDKEAQEWFHRIGKKTYNEGRDMEKSDAKQLYNIYKGEDIL